MDAWVSRIVGAVIILVAFVLASWHVRVRRGQRRDELTPVQYDFYRRQFRRRMQVSVMVGVLGVFIAVESFVDAPMIRALLGIGMLALLLWIVFLAVADAFWSRAHFDRLQNDFVIEQAKLEIEARRLRSVGGNGRSDDEPLGSDDDGSL